MRRNIGNTWRVIRILLGITLGLLYVNGSVKHGWGIVLLVMGIYLVITGLTGICLMNKMLGINTAQRKLKEPTNPY